MGFLDDMQASINRTTSSVSRSAQASGLRRQINDALKRRQQLAAQLGASLYEATKDNEELRAGREALFDGIAQIDAEREQCEAQIKVLEQQAQEEAVAAQTFECPFCHSRVSAADMFCSGCGKPMAEIQASIAEQAAKAQAAQAAQMASYQQAVQSVPVQQPASAGAVCPSCGSPVNPGDAFCMNCGHRMA